ncbi:hypothetical protein F4553_007360 [Allocatelliglobosispora scoriae]|uniref:Hsp70 family protein n=1 Tax=Allocatelliglobosispora scoriae TaxID=643052 RepID=A0A841C216_9ACTN|nr:Hsp70 family protein [Allocatelliglobosispora scoriae]MBB5873926.1 hypothetical protein [Allocatelliglobosispora scoriae]
MAESTPAHQPTLIVDFGTHETSAVVATGPVVTPVLCPMTGAPRWPSAVFLDHETLLIGAAAQQRRDTRPRWYASGLRSSVDTGTPLPLGEGQVAGGELLARYLSVVRAEAERQHGERIERLAMTVPAGYGPLDPRREAMVAMAAEAGFPAAELVSDAVAALRDPLLRADPAEGAIVLVCDLGASWTVTLHRMHAEHPIQLAEDTCSGGQSLDSILLQDLAATLPDWVPAALSAPGDDGLRARFTAADFVRRLKHRLAADEQASDWLAAGVPPYSLDRAALDRFAEPSVRWLLASCRAMIARSGFTPGEVAGIALVGGAAKLPGVGKALRLEFGRPVWQPAEPELAVVRGAARWADRASGRRIAAVPPAWRLEPLAWTLPTGRARLVRWTVGPGESYPGGAVLAQVRSDDDRIFDLTAAREGIMAEHRVRPGSFLDSDVIAGMARSVKVISGDRPNKRVQLRVDGEWLLSPDRSVLVECPSTGAWVRTRSIATGAVLSELRPSYPGPEPEHGRVFVAPDGSLTLVAWDPQGRFFVWDIASGLLRSQFRAGAKPLTVLVNETMWRLISELDKVVHVGRYRRDVAMMWDLSTGAVVEEMVGEDLHRRFGGFADHSGADGFAAETRSPNGRLLAAARQSAGAVAVSLQEAETGQELFRADLSSARSVRTAFSADGQHLLACSSSDEGSCVDIWRV